MWYELVHCSKEKVVVVVVLSGKSVIAVGVRCTDVRANELLVVRGCCVPYVQQCSLLHSTSHVFALGGNG